MPINLSDFLALVWKLLVDVFDTPKGRQLLADLAAYLEQETGSVPQPPPQQPANTPPSGRMVAGQ